MIDDEPLPDPIPDPRPFDPKLREAMEEIKAVLTKYDIGGYVYLGSQTHGEYLYALRPSWSMLTTEAGPSGLFVRFKTAGLPKTTETQQKVAASIGLIAGIKESVADASGYTQQLLNMISEHMDFKHVSKPSPPDVK